MEAKILDKLHNRKPMPKRKLMTACGVRDTKRVGHISYEAFDFVQLLEKMQGVGHLILTEGQGWIKPNESFERR